MTWAARPSPSRSGLLRGRLRPPGDSHQFTFLVTRLLCGGVVFALRHPPSTDKTRFFVYSLRNRHSTQITQRGGGRAASLYTGRLVSRTKFALRRGLFGYTIFTARKSLGVQTRSESPLPSVPRWEKLTERCKQETIIGSSPTT